MAQAGTFHLHRFHALVRVAHVFQLMALVVAERFPNKGGLLEMRGHRLNHLLEQVWCDPEVIAVAW